MSLFQFLNQDDIKLATLDRSDVGAGLALTYWNGFLRFILIRDDDEPSCMKRKHILLRSIDMNRQFRRLHLISSCRSNA